MDAALQQDTETLRISSARFCELARQTLDAEHVFRFQANGCSMRPTIVDGDIITVIPTGARRPKLGDIVLHRTGGGGVVAHRIIRISNRGLGRMYCTRGDAFGAHGELIEEEDILGLVTRMERGRRARRLDRNKDRRRGLITALRRGLGQLVRDALYRG